MQRSAPNVSTHQRTNSPQVAASSDRRRRSLAPVPAIAHDRHPDAAQLQGDVGARRQLPQRGPRGGPAPRRAARRSCARRAGRRGGRRPSGRPGSRGPGGPAPGSAGGRARRRSVSPRRASSAKPARQVASSIRPRHRVGAVVGDRRIGVPRGGVADADEPPVAGRRQRVERPTGGGTVAEVGVPDDGGDAGAAGGVAAAGQLGHGRRLGHRDHHRVGGVAVPVPPALDEHGRDHVVARRPCRPAGRRAGRAGSTWVHRW